MTVLLLIRETLLDYCHMQPLPTIPPDKNSETIIALSMCVTIGLIVLLSAVYYAIVRLRTATQEEFKEANDRLGASIPNLAMLKGKELRRLCRSISYDIIQVTGFAEKQVSLCFHEHGATHDQRLSMLEFMWENKALRVDAVVVRLLYCLPFIRPLRSTTKRMTEQYSTEWMRLLQRFRFKNPECSDL